ncbi:PREDICTED: phospholipase A2 inhibitor and Ly6/PLAUR domain-containing protein [Thamnophis sirtalis]|uniref:Phospholipase A2 inhibitor and Ly6/PLAUR domain-containing protein n=1 Tax=Thamnophis sirtalis TaxID=35019 RepID=A0A6I9Y6Q2_9SAUR|nr:PREDICTED: phospholipase A2 inhibitor and Ly6/PLAUR domain-containing protein [Thamnophis sirtalis]
MSVTCGESEDTCLTFVGINYMGSEKITETVKGCSVRSACLPGPISVTINSQIYFWSNSSCCQGDQCNNQKLDMPAENTTLNGLSCPTCFILASDECDEMESLNCVGEDNHCITTSGTLTAEGIPVAFASSGCSSASACALPLDTNIYSAGITFHLKKIVCSPAVRANSP